MADRTKGNWKVRIFGDTAPGIDVAAEDGTFLASIKHNYRGGMRPPRAEAIANAYAMAAAPKLIAALYRVGCQRRSVDVIHPDGSGHATRTLLTCGECFVCEALMAVMPKVPDEN